MVGDGGLCRGPARRQPSPDQLHVQASADGHRRPSSFQRAFDQRVLLCGALAFLIAAWLALAFWGAAFF
ncbi:MAG TPA: hypothetical protein VID93_02785, partial [Acidimicrobiales bacterium]